jgi:hypothetical protein
MFDDSVVGSTLCGFGGYGYGSNFGSSFAVTWSGCVYLICRFDEGFGG